MLQSVQAGEQGCLLEQFITLCEVIPLLYCVLPIRGDSLRLHRHMIAIVKAIVSEVVANSGNQNGKLLNRR